MANLHKTGRKLPWLWRDGGLNSAELKTGVARTRTHKHTHGALL